MKKKPQMTNPSYVEEERLFRADKYIQRWCFKRLILGLVYSYLYYLIHR